MITTTTKLSKKKRERSSVRDGSGLVCAKCELRRPYSEFWVESARRLAKSCGSCREKARLERMERAGTVVAKTNPQSRVAHRPKSSFYLDRPPSEFKILLTKIPGKCVKCANRIHTGNTAAWHPDLRRTFCMSCFQKLEHNAPVT